jgi:hypothetical protein
MTTKGPQPDGSVDGIEHANPGGTIRHPVTGRFGPPSGRVPADVNSPLGPDATRPNAPMPEVR